MGQLPTVEDVARVAQVSRQTVSNVLNTPDIVRPETRDRVRAAIDQLGYRPHASARRLRTQKSSTIGVRLDPLQNGISGGVLDRFLHALTEQADARNMRILLYTAPDHEGEIEQIRRLLDGADVDAFVLTATSYDDPRTDWLLERRVPFVTFGRPWGVDDMSDPKHLWVDVDGFSGAREATEHLLRRAGRRVAFLGWPHGSGTGDDRRRGWLAAMGDAGVPEAELAGLEEAAEDRVVEARKAVERLIQTGGGLPDALVAASDTLALGALMVASGIGRPDLPIVGFDNTPIAQALGISSVEQRVDQVAEGALQLLMGETGSSVVTHDFGSGDPKHRLITPKLVVRRSSHLAPAEEAGGTESGNHNRKDKQR
ncbi:LacI family DNA-binding transcriptional regulator [Lysobacter korlensis]|uniref:LacI family DNA-binding transcriptional regulator n=1 Tax=Lysobacter korlensis TaxID=553636 RepID=A0ABV6RVI4_9GAMM